MQKICSKLFYRFVLKVLSFMTFRWWSSRGGPKTARSCTVPWAVAGTAVKRINTGSTNSWSSFRMTPPTSVLTPPCQNSTTRWPLYGPSDRLPVEFCEIYRINYWVLWLFYFARNLPDADYSVDERCIWLHPSNIRWPSLLKLVRPHQESEIHQK